MTSFVYHFHFLATVRMPNRIMMGNSFFSFNGFLTMGAFSTLFIEFRSFFFVSKSSGGWPTLSRFSLDEHARLNDTTPVCQR